MKLSSTARYGLRAMADLCVHSSNNRPVSVNDIALRQNISVNYLEQLFGRMRRAGLLESVRGALGGYKLARSASEITMSDILEALDEPFIFGSCQTEWGCENAVTCPTFKLWQKVKGSVDEVLDSTTLEDLADERISLIESLSTDPEREMARDRALLRRRSK